MSIPVNASAIAQADQHTERLQQNLLVAMVDAGVPVENCRPSQREAYQSFIGQQAQINSDNHVQMRSPSLQAVRAYISAERAFGRGPVEDFAIPAEMSSALGISASAPTPSPRLSAAISARGGPRPVGFRGLSGEAIVMLRKALADAAVYRDKNKKYLSPQIQIGAQFRTAGVDRSNKTLECLANASTSTLDEPIIRPSLVNPHQQSGTTSIGQVQAHRNNNGGERGLTRHDGGEQQQQQQRVMFSRILAGIVVGFAVAVAQMAGNLGSKWD